MSIELVDLVKSRFPVSQQPELSVLDTIIKGIAGVVFRHSPKLLQIWMIKNQMKNDTVIVSKTDIQNCYELKFNGITCKVTGDNVVGFEGFQGFDLKAYLLGDVLSYKKDSSQHPIFSRSDFLVDKVRLYRMGRLIGSCNSVPPGLDIYHLKKDLASVANLVLVSHLRLMNSKNPQKDSIEFETTLKTNGVLDDPKLYAAYLIMSGIVEGRRGIDSFESFSGFLLSLHKK